MPSGTHMPHRYWRVTPPPFHAGKTGRTWQIDWSPRGYSPLRLPAGTLVTFKYRAGGGAVLHDCCCARFCELLLTILTAFGCTNLLHSIVQSKMSSFQARLTSRHHAGLGYGTRKCLYRATFVRNSRKGGSLSVKIPKGMPNSHETSSCGTAPCCVKCIRLLCCSRRTSSLQLAEVAAVLV